MKNILKCSLALLALAACSSKGKPPVEKMPWHTDEELVPSNMLDINPGVRACYVKVLKSDPAVRGQILFRWEFSYEGEVINLQKVIDSTKSPELRDCVAGVIRAFRVNARYWHYPIQRTFVFDPATVNTGG